MRRTFHFANGRGLETDRCCCTVQRCAYFHSVMFCVLSLAALIFLLLAPASFIGRAARLVLCTLTVFSLVSSLLAPIAIYRRSCLLLAPFITLIIVLLSMCIGLMLTTAICAYIEDQSPFDMKTIVRDALESGAIYPLAHFLIGPKPMDDHLSDYHFIAIFSFFVVLFILCLAILIHALTVTAILWRRFLCQAVLETNGSMEWLFANVNPSYCGTVRRVPPKAPHFEQMQWKRRTYISMDDGLDVTF